ncbi:MAG: hypothetical protein KKE11_01270 [Gammaproteobacteria bacterium]|nr:hypothetical protein [Gammaproteobacteria bacterium]
MYEKEGNIFIKLADGKERQLTYEDCNYQPQISPDAKQIMYIKHTKECPFTENDPWFPADFDEIWSMNIDGSGNKCIIKNNYVLGQDMQYYLGSFGSLTFSPDGKYIYFLCQNCAVDAILYRANSDGSDIDRLTNAHQLDVIGGHPEDEYYGYLVAGMRKSSGAEPIKWTTVLMDSDGKEIKEINDLDKFWTQHKKIIENK